MDIFIVAENATKGQEIFNLQRKKMFEELGFSCEIFNIPWNFYMPWWQLLTLEIGYKYRRFLNRKLLHVQPKIIYFSQTATMIFQKKNTFKKFKTVCSFDLPFCINQQYFGSSILHLLEKRAFDRTDRLLPWNNYSKPYLVNRYHIPEGKISVIPFAVNYEEINRRQQKRDTMISFGSHDPHKKGIDALIHAWCLLNEKHGYKNKFKLLVTGLGEEKAKTYLRKCNIKKIPDNVSFVGMVPHEKHLQLLAESRLFISASRYEEFGIVHLEALATGTPVVSTPTIGPSEFLLEIDKNLVSPTFSYIDLANTIRHGEKLAEKGDEIFNKIKKTLNKYDYSLIKRKLKEEVLKVL